jgi:hypothetical protein
MTSRQREGIGSFCCGRITHKGARASSRKKSWKVPERITSETISGSAEGRAATPGSSDVNGGR